MNTEQKLLSLNLGLRVWEKGGHRRIYVNSDEAMNRIFGLSVERYNTGRICSATLNGECISNSKARAICGCNPYYDCVAEKWVNCPLKAFALEDL